jgi:hypothetical protein
LLEVIVQQPKAENALDDVVGAAAPMVAARLVGSVITVKGMVVLPTHGDVEAGTGVGTTISGLMPPTPTSIPVAGTVASLYVGAVVVARPGIVTATLAPNASMMAAALALELQAPVMIELPKE